MRVAVFSSRAYERPFLDSAAAAAGLVLSHHEASLDARTAALARDCQGAAIFVNDHADAAALAALHAEGVRVVALRCAGFNNVGIAEAARLGMRVFRVPAYSPHAVAEHTVGLMLTLNRKFHRAYARVREQNFSLGGLMGFDMHGKTVGVVGTGRIGQCVCRILAGIGCRLLVHDPSPSAECLALGAVPVPLAGLLEHSDIVTLHCPLTPGTRHMLDAAAFARMRPGAMLINTGRGALVDTRALIGALKRGHLGSVGLDVYEEEDALFFRDLSDAVLTDDLFARLLTFPNVLITAHQGFFTREAMEAIAATTAGNLAAFARGQPVTANEVTPSMVA